MKIFIVAHVVTAICFTCVFWVSTSSIPHPQYIEDPSIFYQPLDTELKLKGGYNISICVEDLMSCWELVRGEVYCDQDYIYETICPYMKEHCHDFYGYYPSRLEGKWTRFFEIWCPKNPDNYYNPDYNNST